MAAGRRVPPGIDVTRANIARVYDVFLDGKDNFAADRAVAAAALQIAPDSAGLVPLPEWRPDTAGPPVRDSTYHGFVCGVARKP